VPVLPDDTERSLAARVLEQEHRLYPRAIRWLVEGALEVRAGVVGTRRRIAVLEPTAQPALPRTLILRLRRQRLRRSWRRR
jgi:hypothetical protein